MTILFKSQHELKKLVHSFADAQTNIGLIYLFGSQAKGEAHEKSDYDFAIAFIDGTKEERAETKLSFISSMSQSLQCDKVDLIDLDQDISPLLKYQVLCEGILLFERSAHRLHVEPKILNLYFDFSMMRKKRKGYENEMSQ